MPEDRKRKAQGNSHVDTTQQQSNPEKRKKYNPPSVTSEPSIVPAITSSKQSSDSVALSSEVTPVKQSKSKSNLTRFDTPETYTPTISPITKSRRIKQIERSYKNNISVPKVKGVVAEQIVADSVKKIGLIQVPCGKNGLDLVFTVKTEEQLVALKTLLYQSAATNQLGQRNSQRLSEKSKRSNTEQQIKKYWDTVCGTYGIPTDPPFLVVIETKSDNATLTRGQKNPESYIRKHLEKLAKKEHSGTLIFEPQDDIQQTEQHSECIEDTKDEYIEDVEQDDSLQTPDYYARICEYPILPLLVRANNFQHDTVELSIDFWEQPTKGSRRIATNPITAPIPDDCHHLANSTQIGSATEDAIIGWLVKCNQWHYAGDVKHTGEHGIDAIFFDDAGNVYVVEIKGHIHTDNYERKPFGRHSLSLYDNQLSKAQKNPVEFVKNACKKAIEFSTTSQQSRKNALGLQQLLKENYPHVYFRQATAFLPNYGEIGTLDVTVKQWGTQEEAPYLQEQDDATLSSSNMAITPPAILLFDRQNIHTYQYRPPFNGRSTSPQTCSSSSSTSSTMYTSSHPDNTNLFYPKLTSKPKAKRQLDRGGAFDQEFDDSLSSEDSDSELAGSPDFGSTDFNTIADDTFDFDSPLVYPPEHELTAPDTDTENHYDPADPKGKREVDDGTEDPLAEVFPLYDAVDSFHSANPNSFFAPYPASPQGTMSFTHVVEKDTTEDMNILP